MVFVVAQIRANYSRESLIDLLDELNIVYKGEYYVPIVKTVGWFSQACQPRLKKTKNLNNIMEKGGQRLFADL